MERVVYGKNRNEKPITSHSEFDDFVNYEEIFDSYAVLSLMASRAYRARKQDVEINHLANEVEKLDLLLSVDNQLQVQKSAIGAVTSIDIRNYAVTLLSPEFKE